MMSISLNGVHGVETADETVCLRGAVVTPLEDSRMSWSRYRIMFVLGYAKNRGMKSLLCSHSCLWLYALLPGRYALQSSRIFHMGSRWGYMAGHRIGYATSHKWPSGQSLVRCYGSESWCAVREEL